MLKLTQDGPVAEDRDDGSLRSGSLECPYGCGIPRGEYSNSCRLLSHHIPRCLRSGCWWPVYANELCFKHQPKRS
jgi:hypothetical protein